MTLPHSSDERHDPHAALMDGIYHTQRHFYDLTRKYYLLGRDRMIERLDVPPGGRVLELGCGTGRNIVLAARRYPDAAFSGLDISSEMLVSASASVVRAGLVKRIRLARADATAFDSQGLFGIAGYDRVFLSYALSMIPEWTQAIRAALEATAPGGSLHIVDFGRQERLPPWFRKGLRAWLAKFHVAPRDILRDVLESECERLGATLSFDSIFRGYAVVATVTISGRGPA